MNHICLKHRRGVTLVEILIGTILAVMLIALSVGMIRFVRRHQSVGTSDLRELQDARLAISHLRRDFRSATINTESNVTLSKQRNLHRNPLVQAGSWRAESGVTPIIVDRTSIQFFKQSFETDSTDKNPKLQQIMYQIDSSRNCLVRSGPGFETAFTSIINADFRIYGHPLNKDVPVLLVKFDIMAEDLESHQNMEFVTTISSSVISQKINNLSWHHGL